MTSTNATGNAQGKTEWFVVITLSALVHRQVGTVTLTFKPKLGTQVTREQLFQWALSQAPPEFAQATVLFFDAHPNIPIEVAMGGER